jgi:hypothetical protein
LLLKEAAMKIVSDAELKQLRVERRRIEVGVAETIARYLVESAVATEIKTMIVNIIEMILDLEGRLGYVALELKLEQKTSFAMWHTCQVKPSRSGLKAVRHYVSDGPAGQDWLNVCSDVIRLFGELSEDPAARVAWGPGLGSMAHKDALRPAPVFAKPARDDHGWGHRDRSEIPARTRIEVSKPFVDIPRDIVRWRGVEKFKFGGRSIMQIIDWTFGLPIEGGDVSGTTTDSIAALRWAGEDHLNATSQLIAIATMVPQGHHTIVECAWPLTRQGCMNYSIGFYDTLLPAGSNLHELESALKPWESDKFNQHVLVATGNMKSATLNFVFESPAEVLAYKAVSNVRGAYGFCSGGRPDLQGLENLLASHGVPADIIGRLAYLAGT